VSFALKCVVELAPASESGEAAASRAEKRAYLTERGYSIVTIAAEAAATQTAQALDDIAAALPGMADKA
jgi:very-short-patch-repair endonuclease